MAQDKLDLGRKLEPLRNTLIDEIARRCHARCPDIETRGGEPARLKCREDVSDLLAHLDEAIAARQPALFHHHIVWRKATASGRDVPTVALADLLSAAGEALRERLSPADVAEACGPIDSALAELPKMPTAPPMTIAAGQPLGTLLQSFMSALLAGQRAEARRMILDSVQNGTPIRDVYLHVLQKSQHEMGRLWQAKQICVAQEHYCTAITQAIMSQLEPHFGSTPRIGRSFIGMCVSSDLHEIGVRMVCDFLEMEGWDTYYLGASMPGPDLIRIVGERRTDVVGISATLTPHVLQTAKLIAMIRAAPNCKGVKIIVGGYPFRIAPSLWQVIGADGSSSDALGSVELANRLAGVRKVA